MRAARYAILLILATACTEATDPVVPDDVVPEDVTTADDTGAVDDTEDGATDDGAGCETGAEGCPCFGNGTCLGELECDGDLCAAPACEQGTEGCGCFGNGTCLGDLTCEADVCTAACTQGTAGCPCFGNGTCLGGLACEDGTCACTPGTEGCVCEAGDACGPDLRCAAGTCEACPEGTLGCACDGASCGAGMTCEAGACVEDTCEAGTQGCPCLAGDTCSGANLECSSGTCSPLACPAGSQGCPCPANGECGDDLSCQGVGSAATCEPCPEGTEGCPCGSGCHDGLSCADGLCATSCPAGTLGCPCDAGACTGSGVICEASLCVQAPCEVGAEGCPCTASGACDLTTTGEQLLCESGLCTSARCVPGDLGCACALGADCNGGVCKSGFCQLSDCAKGQQYCGCAGTVCAAGLSCHDGAICLDKTGLLGGPCGSGDTCDVDLACQDGACVTCVAGGLGCACLDGATCDTDLACENGTCVSPTVVYESPCYTHCSSSFVDSVEGKLHVCPSDNLIEGCFNGNECLGGWCLPPGSDERTCVVDTDCAAWQACDTATGSCYSDCTDDGGCKNGYACDLRVCRQECSSDDDCPDDHACLGYCLYLEPGGSSSTTSVEGEYVLTPEAFEFSNVTTSAKLNLTNDSLVAETFRIRKRSESSKAADTTLTVYDDEDDGVACNPLSDCPLVWLTMNVQGESAAPVQELQVTVPAGGQVVIELANAGGTDAVRWDGVLEVLNDELGDRTIPLSYNEVPEGRWGGTVHYFANFGDSGLDAWAADKENNALIQDVGNALIQRWAAFRKGNLSFEEWEAVLTSTENESWDWATVEKACLTAFNDADAICYPSQSNQAGVQVYTSNSDLVPVPNGAVTFPFAMNIHQPDPSTQPGLMSGRIESSESLQYAGNPAIYLDFGAGVDPSECELEVGGACLVMLDDLFAQALVGGRYTTDSTDTNCSKRLGQGYEQIVVPWLVPGFTQNTETDVNGLSYRYECRDTLLPDSGDGTLTDAQIESNLSLALANPVPDARTRRRTLELVDGALVNQSELFIIFKEELAGVLPDGTPLTAYGYLRLTRERVDLDTTDEDGDTVADVYQGVDPEDTRTEPDDVLGMACSTSLVKAAIGTSTVTSSNAEDLALTLITGRQPSEVEDTIGETSAEVVHYLCHETGLFDGGPHAVTSPFATITQTDACGFASAAANSFDGNGSCDDGGPGADTAICPLGTDMTDCPDRKGSDQDLRVACPLGSDVTWFTLDNTWTQSDIAGLDCQDDGSCFDTLQDWRAQGVLVQDEPVWRCTDASAYYCDADRLDLRNDKTFYAATDLQTKFDGLYAATSQAFRYRTQFVTRDGDSPGFAPELCDESSNLIPYCYDAPEIEAIRERVDCLMYVWENHFEDLSTTTAPSGVVPRDVVADFLCTNFAYADACLDSTDDASITDGFERLYAELLVMMGDESYTRAFASRFDLAGQSPVSFEGSLFEDDGIDLSGAAGYEMYSLYQATQYYQQALDRFFALAPSIWTSAQYATDGDAPSQINFVTADTVTRYFERLIRASTQKSRAWSEAAKRYQSFDQATLAREVVARAYTATYLESLILSRMMLAIMEVLKPEERPQVAQVIADAQRRYRMALLDMQNVYRDISDEVRYFGLPPEYVPFPTVESTEANVVDLLLIRARQRSDAAKVLEDAAIERSKAFETESAQFQSELVQLRTTYESQLIDICGSFESGGKVYPAINKYAELDDTLAKMSTACGGVSNGQIYEALVQVELARTELQRIRTSAANVLEEAAIEKARVEAQCNQIVTLANYTYTQSGTVNDLQTDIADLQFTIGAIDRTLNAMSTSAQLANTTSIAGAVISAAAITATLVGNAYAAKLEYDVKDLEEDIRDIERDTARWESLAQCDAALIDANARMATILLRLKEIDLEATRAMLQLRLEVSQIDGLMKKAKRIEDDLTEAQQLQINLAASRSDPNVRIYRDDTIVNAENAFEVAIKEAYRATRVFEYYTSQSYADLEKLFLTRMIQYGEYNLQTYLTNLESAFYEFEETYGLPDTRVARISLRDDILNIPYSDDDGATIAQTDRIEAMRAVLADASYLDENGYLTIDFPTKLEDLSPLTRVHKIIYVEAEIIGSSIGDTVGRLYLRQKGTSVIHGLDDDTRFYRFPARTAVLNPYFNGNKVFDAAVYQNGHLRQRPFVNTNWALIINQRDEKVNKDIDLQSLTDIRLYIYYNDFTEL